MKTALMRRLQALEARCPTAEEEYRRQNDEAWQTIVNHPQAADLLRILDRVAKLEAEGHTLFSREVVDLMDDFCIILKSTGDQDGPERMHR
ncbi:MAG: hypothetical protein ACOX9B_10065 [Candidatus Xenobium sp.]|jgi:hypothetical protein